MKKSIIVHITLMAFSLPACMAPVAPTPTAIPLAVPQAAATSEPPTNMPNLPTEVSAAISALLPNGEPEIEWNGIPIMPEAIAGEGDVEAYRFTVKSNRQEINEFYERELEKLGWTSLAGGEGNAGVYLLFFTDPQDATLSITLIPNGDEILVMLVK